MGAIEGIDLRIWGKERGLDVPYPLVWHLVDTAGAVLVLWADYLTPSQRRVVAGGLGLSESDARLVAAFWAGLHDLGKCMAEFQQLHPPSLEQLVQAGYSGDRPGSPLRHDRASQLVSYSLLQDIGYGAASSNRPAAASPEYRCAQVLGGHHGLFQQGVDLLHLRDPVVAATGVGGGLWHRQRVLLVGALLEVLGAPPVPQRTEPVALTLVTGLLILADWLVSQEGYLRARQLSLGVDGSAVGIAKHLALTRSLVPGLLRDAGLVRAEVHRGPFVDAFRFAPNALQRSIVEELVPRVKGAGLLVVTAAPGEGKTEAALFAAEALAAVSGAAGCYFALPTMATADQMYLRVRAFAGRRTTNEATLTLLHSLSWLNPDYSEETGNGAVMSDDPGGRRGRVTATEWLRGPKRPLLASFAVGTIDQGLMAVLPLKHNALRLLALSGKVLVVDEAHAYDAYMQFLLRRLLSWLGALGCPVVLLSATLPSRVVRSLASAYLRGAKQEPPDWVRHPVRYPGWLFVPADGGDPVQPTDEAAALMAASRNADLQVDVRPVRHVTGEAALTEPRERLRVLRGVLAPVAEAGGCVAVICNTVADAQRTYVELRSWAGNLAKPPDLYLLHARFPAQQRRVESETIATLFGKAAAGRRPRAAIVVATQVMEQSLDLDFDLVVSDLAPMALLLQRAGRCWRHVIRGRPVWSVGPRLVVLDPVAADGRHVRPRLWGRVYPAYLLRRTHDVLRRGHTSVAIPGDVQDLVEEVYCPAGEGSPLFLADDAETLRGEWDEYEGERLAHEALAGNIAINEPQRVGDIKSLTDKDVPEAILTTRLGADTCRLVCCYVDDAGRRWLDPGGEVEPLPERGRKGRFSSAEIRAILQRTVPVRDSEVDNAGPAHQPPAAWLDHTWLKDLLLLPHRVERDGGPPVPVGNLPMWVDPILGLCTVRSSA